MTLIWWPRVWFVVALPEVIGRPTFMFSAVTWPEVILFVARTLVIEWVWCRDRLTPQVVALASLARLIIRMAEPGHRRRPWVSVQRLPRVGLDIVVSLMVNSMFLGRSMPSARFAPMMSMLGAATRRRKVWVRVLRIDFD